MTNAGRRLKETEQIYRDAEHLTENAFADVVDKSNFQKSTLGERMSSAMQNASQTIDALLHKAAGSVQSRKHLQRSGDCWSSVIS